MSNHFKRGNATKALRDVVVEPGDMIYRKSPKLDVVGPMLSLIQSSVDHERTSIHDICIALSASKF